MRRLIADVVAGKRPITDLPFPRGGKPEDFQEWWNSLPDEKHDFMLVLKTIADAVKECGDMADAVKNGEHYVGRLTTVNDDPYPGLAHWFAQIRRYESDDSSPVVARAYGDTVDEARQRAEVIAAALNAKPISQRRDESA